MPEDSAATGAGGTSSVPLWLLQGDVGKPALVLSGRRKRTSYVEKTLSGGADLLRQVVFSDEVAGRPGFLQRADPRCKLVAMLALLVAAGLVHNAATLAVLYLATLALAAACSVPVGFFVKRVWVFIPVFTLVIMLPATLSVVTPGHVVVVLWHSGAKPEGFSSQGLTSALLVTARVAVSVSLVVLVTLTTPWARLLAALRALGVPRMFVLVVGMAYRYIFLLAASVAEMYESRAARSVLAERHDRGARRFVASTAGALFAKSTYLSEEVHQAMVSRGYRGDPKPLRPFRWSSADLVFCLAALAVAVAVVGGDRLVGR